MSSNVSIYNTLCLSIYLYIHTCTHKHIEYLPPLRPSARQTEVRRRQAARASAVGLSYGRRQPTGVTG